MSDERDEKLGEGTGRLGPWADDDDEHATQQRGDPHVLDVEGDPRGGTQADEYRHADPREVVEEEEVAMSGPGGAPQEGKTVEQRRAESDEWRREKREVREGGDADVDPS